VEVRVSPNPMTQGQRILWIDWEPKKVTPPSRELAAATRKP
jgi:hypothetical protein